MCTNVGVTLINMKKSECFFPAFSPSISLGNHDIRPRLYASRNSLFLISPSSSPCNLTTHPARLTTTSLLICDRVHASFGAPSSHHTRIQHRVIRQRDCGVTARSFPFPFSTISIFHAAFSPPPPFLPPLLSPSFSAPAQAFFSAPIPARVQLKNPNHQTQKFFKVKVSGRIRSLVSSLFSFFLSWR